MARVILTHSKISGISAAMKIIQINSMRNYKYQLRAPSSSDTLVSAAAFICGGVSADRKRLVKIPKTRSGATIMVRGVATRGVVTCL